MKEKMYVTEIAQPRSSSLDIRRAKFWNRLTVRQKEQRGSNYF